MTKCPDCHAVFESQPGRCSQCGYQFATNPKANVPSQRRMSLTQARIGCLTIIGLAVALLLYRSHDEPQAIINSPASSAPGTSRPAPSHTPPTATPGPVGAGITATVVEGRGFWPCGSTTAAYDELMKWSVRGDMAEVRRTLTRTRSIGIVGGMKVKVLDIGFGRKKIRVLTNSAGQSTLRDEQGVFSADPRIGRECWVVSEALSR